MRVVAGAAAGYLAFCLFVLATVSMKYARLHYFDKEALVYGVISPIGGLGAFAKGDWNYPAWVWGRNLFAYVLVLAGVVVGFRSKQSARAASSVQ